MKAAVQWLLVLVLAACCAVAGAAQRAAASQGLLYKGTVGQQHVTMLLDVQGDTLKGGHYSYDGQKSDIRFTEVRVYGTTAALQDEDGNTLHLHLRTAGGEGAADWKAAAALEGTLVRGNLDLPVKLTKSDTR